MSRSLINFIAFQIGWFCCVLGAANALPWLGPIAAIPILFWHLSQSENWAREANLLVIAVLLGAAFDQSLLSLGWLHYPASSWPASLLPVWMLVLWVLFASTLNLSLRWLRKSYLLAGFFGAVGGPLAYMAGVKLGAMVWLNEPAMLVALAIGWGSLCPLLVWISVRFDGYLNLHHQPIDPEHVQHV